MPFGRRDRDPHDGASQFKPDCGPNCACGDHHPCRNAISDSQATPKPTPTKTAAPKSTPTKTAAPKPSPTVASAAPIQGVHPGAFCSQHGLLGYTTTGKLMRCTTSATDSRYRWRAA